MQKIRIFKNDVIIKSLNFPVVPFAIWVKKLNIVFQKNLKPIVDAKKIKGNLYQNLVNEKPKETNETENIERIIG